MGDRRARKELKRKRRMRAGPGASTPPKERPLVKRVPERRAQGAPTVKVDPGGVAACGECTLCCKVLGIEIRGGERRLSDLTEDGNKPIDEWCLHCSQEHGCRIYEEDDKPIACADFECWWLQSQRTDMKMPLEERPDKVRGVLVSNPDGVVTVNVSVEDHGAWRRGKLSKMIGRLDRAGLVVFAACGDERYAVSDEAVKLVERGVKIE